MQTREDIVTRAHFKLKLMIKFDNIEYRGKLKKHPLYPIIDINYYKRCSLLPF